MPLTHFTELQRILRDITAPNGWLLEALDYTPRSTAVHLGHRIDVEERFAPIWFIRIVCEDDKCNVTGEPKSWTGRKWYISHHSTVSEVIQTALKAVLTAMEHEAREQFRYRGVAVLDPHLDLEYLAVVDLQPSLRATGP